jgi:uncharacterized damage-inducible protein DinB
VSGTRQLRMLTRYNAWANARLFDAVAALPAGEASAPRKTIFGNMVQTLNHDCVVDQIWQAHLEGRPHGFTARVTQPEPALSDLREKQARLDRWFIEHSDDLAPEKHDEVVHFKFVDGGAGALTRSEIVLHVVNHKTYHRGFVADMLCQAGVRPPVMDLPVFLRDAPAGL